MDVAVTIFIILIHAANVLINVYSNLLDILTPTIFISDFHTIVISSTTTPQ